MAWIWLTVAGLLEIVWAIGLKYTDGEAIDTRYHGGDGDARGPLAREAVGVLQADGPDDFKQPRDGEPHPGH